MLVDTRKDLSMTSRSFLRFALTQASELIVGECTYLFININLHNVVIHLHRVHTEELTSTRYRRYSAKLEHLIEPICKVIGNVVFKCRLAITYKLGRSEYDKPPEIIAKKRWGHWHCGIPSLMEHSSKLTWHFAFAPTRFKSAVTNE